MKKRIPQQPKSIRLTPRVIVTIVTMTVTLCMLVASATAWLTVNRVAESNGVEMEVSGTSNLVIASEPGIMDSDNYTTYKITFASNTNTYIPATHDYDDEYGSPVHLKYLLNPEQIDPTTGLAGEDDYGSPFEAEFDAVPAENNSEYYKDYNVYIASAGGELTNTDLVIRLTFDEENTEESNLALSADFYWHGPNDADYEFAGTLNLAWMDNRFNDGTGLDELPIFTGTIPACTVGEIAFLVRVYYDGALLDYDGNTYVRTGILSTQKAGFGIVFEAVEASEPYPWWPLDEE